MILNIVFGIISIIGTVLTVFYGLKVSKLEKAKRTLTWHDLQMISDSTALSLKKDNFLPEVILCPGLRGGILAELFLNKFERNIPVFIGISHRDFSKINKLNIAGYKRFIIADDWDILIPDVIFTFKNKKILIIDDFCLTGTFFQNLRQHLIDNGFNNEKIKIFSSVITKVTKVAGRAPEYYAIVTDDDYIYFPWGKANMG